MQMNEYDRSRTSAATGTESSTELRKSHKLPCCAPPPLSLATAKFANWSSSNRVRGAASRRGQGCALCHVWHVCKQRSVRLGRLQGGCRAAASAPSWHLETAPVTTTQAWLQPLLEPRCLLTCWYHYRPTAAAPAGAPLPSDMLVPLPAHCCSPCWSPAAF